jgi:hypothetical protein
VGYCGLDRRRVPLTGAEHRGCWVAHLQAAASEPAPANLAGDPDRAVHRLRPAGTIAVERAPRPGIVEGFVPVELADHGPRALQATDPAPPPPPVIEAFDSWPDRETLFGDGEG